VASLEGKSGMTIEPSDAASSLTDIASIERRTRTALYYAHSGEIFMLWGVLTGIGYLLTFFDQEHTRIVWLAVAAAGFLGTFLLTRLSRWRGFGGRDWRYYRAMLVIAGFGGLFFLVLGPWEGRQHSAFWPLLVMLGFVLGGLWMGRFFIGCGLVVSALILAGFFYLPGHWYQLWLAVVEGGGLIAAGWWMMRTGARG
jgi:hypothetical protein